MKKERHAFETEAIHWGEEIDEVTGAVIPPIDVSTTYAFEAIGKTRKYVYGRSQFPLRDLLERKLAALEGAEHALTFASGMAAVHAAASLLAPDDGVLIVDNCYGGTHELFTEFLKPYRVRLTFLDLGDLDGVEKALAGLKPKMLWLESPTNPLMKVCDIAAISKLAKRHSCLVAVDNTFAGPYIQKPLELGADISVYSATKYIGGHSDASMGAVMTNDADIFKRMKLCQHAVGGIPGSLEVFLANRSLKTFLLRLRQQSENAEALVGFLEKQDRVKNIYYPSRDGANLALARRQMKCFGGVFSFELALPMEKIDLFIARLKFFAFAASLGAVESLIAHPASMTHESLTDEELDRIGIKQNLLRISCGIEASEDLIADLGQALDGL